MLLHCSKLSNSLIKERSYFECIYTIAIEIILHLLDPYDMDYIILYELERLFRSELFKPADDLIFRDPFHLTTFNFFNSLEDLAPTKEFANIWEGIIHLFKSEKKGKKETKYPTGTRGRS